MSGRSRRVVQKKGAQDVAAALAQLSAARTGAKRLDTFELKEEKAVYDVVDDEQYAQLVTKRRIEAGQQHLCDAQIGHLSNYQQTARMGHLSRA